MKLHCLALAIVLVLFVTDVTANNIRNHKKHHHHHSKENGENAFEMMEKDDELREKEEQLRLAELAREVERAKEKRERELYKLENEKSDDAAVPLVDPCSRVHCGAGRVCELDDNIEPHCVCISTCPEEQDPRRKVCSNLNETWGSDCSVYQQRCWCDTGDARCKGSQYKHVHIEYYGVCREITECTVEEMSDFPRRMRDWLFNIMRDLADRDELSPHYRQLEREAETNHTRRWVNAAIWKWCDLDGHPHDRSISRHELFPIRAPLVSLEHCIGPFLDGCDYNDDHRISLKEWAKCLEVDEDEVEEKCDDINENE